MASTSESQPPAEAIGGHYTVDLSRPLPLAGGGIPAFGAIDRRAGGRSDLMALQVARHAPARLRPLQVLTGAIEGLLTPFAHGKGPPAGGDAGYYVICASPPGPPLAANLQPWPEPALIDLVLRPMAHALEAMHQRGVTHRAIRAENVFQAQPGQPVILGAAWAAPPAMHQPTVYEPPYAAMCLPAGRGDGSVADDVYALGVLLITLALGRVPMAKMSPADVIRRKLELGSYAAMVGDARLAPGISDLAGMVAEDPDHRPPLKMLQDLAAARGRKVATRPPHRAQRALQIGDTAVWNIRMLAFAISNDPEAGLNALSGIALMPWLRRGLGETGLAVRLEDLLHHRAELGPAAHAHVDAIMLLQVVAQLDPFAPMCWDGVALWPDGLGPALAAAYGNNATVVASLEALIAHEAIAIWALNRQERCDPAALRLDARQARNWLQQRGHAGGLPRVLYFLNPLLPCASRLMAGRWVAELRDIPEALEAAAPAADRSMNPIDEHCAAFVGARSDRRLIMDVNALASTSDTELRLVGQLRLLSELQTRFDPRPLPALARWFAAQASPLVARWQNRQKRAAVAAEFSRVAESGQLRAMLALIEDPAGRAADAEAAERAALELAAIDQELAQISAGSPERSEMAARIGQEVAAGIGLAALALVLIAAALG